MPYRFNIATIDEDEELPTNDEFDNEVDEFEDEGERDYWEATHICGWCNGLDSYCAFCGGSGTSKRKY